jgi:hypothetical protein
MKLREEYIQLEHCYRSEMPKMYKMLILPVVMYVNETWSLSLREEH